MQYLLATRTSLSEATGTRAVARVQASAAGIHRESLRREREEIGLANDKQACSVHRTSSTYPPFGLPLQSSQSVLKSGSFGFKQFPHESTSLLPLATPLQSTHSWLNSGSHTDKQFPQRSLFARDVCVSIYSECACNREKRHSLFESAERNSIASRTTFVSLWRVIRKAHAARVKGRVTVRETVTSAARLVCTTTHAAGIEHCTRVRNMTV